MARLDNSREGSFLETFIWLLHSFVFYILCTAVDFILVGSSACIQPLLFIIKEVINICYQNYTSNCIRPK